MKDAQYLTEEDKSRSERQLQRAHLERNELGEILRRRWTKD